MYGLEAAGKVQWQQQEAWAWCLRSLGEVGRAVERYKKAGLWHAQ